MIIKIQDLIVADACSEQHDKFMRLFPEGTANVTAELCVQHANAFDWGWAAENLLSAAARAEYDKATAAARAEYDKVRAAAWAEYDKATAAAWANAYNRQGILSAGTIGG